MDDNIEVLSNENEEIKELRVDLKIRNNRLIELREKMGLSPAQAAKQAGITYQLWLQYESLSHNPVKKCRREEWRTPFWKTSALKVATFLCAPPEYLWPDAILEVKRNKTTIKVGVDELKNMLTFHEEQRLIESHSDPERDYTQKEMREKVKAALDNLNPKEKEVIIKSYGLDPKQYDQNQSSGEIGRSLDLTRSRICQIEAKALHKMRSAVLVYEPKSLHKQAKTLGRKKA